MYFYHTKITIKILFIHSPTKHNKCIQMFITFLIIAIKIWDGCKIYSHIFPYHSQFHMKWLHSYKSYSLLIFAPTTTNFSTISLLYPADTIQYCFKQTSKHLLLIKFLYSFMVKHPFYFLYVNELEYKIERSGK